MRGGIGLAEEGSGGAGGGSTLLFREARGGGGGGLPSANEAVDGLDAGLGGIFFRFASGLGIAGADSVDIGLGRRPLDFGIEGAGVEGSPGGRGAAAAGSLGADGLELSESEYELSPPAPVLTPPLRFFSFGIPPANMPPSCGAAPTLVALLDPPPVSLLLRPLFPPPGTGGASPPGAFMPGIGGAPAIGGGPELELPLLSIIGADLSLTAATFLRRAVAGPLDISDNKAP